MPAQPAATKRNSVACVPCRTAKLRCSHHNQAPCDRCRASGRTEACHFPPKWTSALHRQPKKPYRATQNHGSSQTSRWTDTASNSCPADPTPVATLEIAPLDLLTDQVQSSYLRCAYKWSFHHRPKLLQQMRDGTLAPSMAWAILAIASRYGPPPPGYSTPLEASAFFAQQAAQVLMDSITDPTLPNIQSLLLLTGHYWGSGDGKSAWIYLGIAVRMVQMMGICSETALVASDSLSSDAFISAEESRRTAWTCFLMESLLSGGGGRSRILKASDMDIQLPCEDESFVFGSPVRCELLSMSSSVPNSTIGVSRPSILAFTIRIADLWGHIAAWASSKTSLEEDLLDQDSEVTELVQLLERWSASLPPRLQFSMNSLHAHVAYGQGPAFCYLHCVYFMSVIFIYRNRLTYLRFSLARRSSRPFETADCTQSAPSHSVYDIACTVCNMCEEIHKLGREFRRGLVPWIGFTLYTAIGALLYFETFPLESDGVGSLSITRDRMTGGLLLLENMKNEWPLAHRWIENIHSLRKFYISRLKGSSSPEDLQGFRGHVTDYGAVHDSPATTKAASWSYSNNAMNEEQTTQQGSELTSHEMPANLLEPTDSEHTEIMLSEEDMAQLFQAFWTMYPGEFCPDPLGY